MVQILLFILELIYPHVFSQRCLFVCVSLCVQISPFHNTMEAKTSSLKSCWDKILIDECEKIPKLLSAVLLSSAWDPSDFLFKFILPPDHPASWKCWVCQCSHICNSHSCPQNYCDGEWMLTCYCSYIFFFIHWNMVPRNIMSKKYIKYLK